jgi:magnesium-transporting ATPase (P-type)
MSESKESEAKQQEVRSKIIKSLDTSKFIHHKLATADALKKLGTNIKTGLTESQVKELTAIHGPNELDEEEGESLWEKIVEQFKDLLV